MKGGDPIGVTVTIADTPRPVDVPEDFATALDAELRARQFFDVLSNSKQRYHVDNINAAKSPDTRQRHVTKAVGLFLDGKQR